MIIIGIAIIILGILFVYGGIREWKGLVDPPKAAAFFYSQSPLRCLFPVEVMKWITIAQGLACIMAGAAFIFKATLS